MHKIAAFFILFLAVISLPAAEIKEIKIISEEGQTVPEHLIFSNMATKVGDQLDQSLLTADIKKLNKTGYFSNIRAKVKPIDKENLILILEIGLMPEILNVDISETEFFDREDILDELSLQSGMRLSNKLLFEDKSALLKLYQEKSYNDTTVTVKTVTLPKNQVNIVWTITESARHKVGDVTFSGNNSIDSGDLDDELKTEKSFWSNIFPTGFLNKQTIELDKLTITKLYRERGYLDVRILNVDLVEDDGRMNVNFQIEEGVRYKVTAITVSGNKVHSTETLLERDIMKAGELFNGKLEEALKNYIERKYHRQGYIDMNCRPVYDKKPSMAEVAINFSIHEGVQARIRNVNVTGNTVTKDYVIRRELLLQPGDKADKYKIDASKNRLTNLDYFEERSIEVIPLATEHENERDLQVLVKDKNTGQVMVGAGVSSEDSVTASFELGQRNFDLLGYPKFIGGGQRANMRIVAGGEYQDYRLSFTEPWLYNKPLRLDTSIYKHSRAYDEYDQDTLGGSVFITRKLDSFFGVDLRNKLSKQTFWRESTGLTLESIELDDFDSYVGPEFLEEEGDYIVSKITRKYVRDSRNSFRYPSRGSKMTISASFQSEIIGAYTNSYDLSLSLDKYYPVFDDCVLHVAGKVAQVNKVSGDDVAIFDRYFAGGPGTVRGFKYRTVGPVDSLHSDPIGGQSMLTGSVELIVPVVERVRFVIFADAGNVWENAWGYNPGEMNVSVGIGLRLQLPIGPIVLDYGFPVVTDQKHLEDASGRLHFKLGYSF